MIRFPAIVTALASATVLAVCGADAGGDVTSQATAACIKANGEAAAAYCNCAASIFNAAFNDKDKAAFVHYLLNDEADPETAMKQASDRGVTLADINSMTMRMGEAGPRIAKECPKKP